MKFVQKEFSSVVEEKKSKFIAHLMPYEEFNSVMQHLKKEHPKARHHVYAYRYLNEFNQIVENSSDDGEPRGTSGKPCLNVLIGAELINTAVIVVRYFGGIKLGTGGLVRAYSDAVNSVIAVSQLIPYQKLERRNITVAYNLLSIVEYVLENAQIQIVNKLFENEVTLTVEATQESLLEINAKLPQGVSVENL